MPLKNILKKSLLIKTLWAKYPANLKPNYKFYTDFRKLVHETEFSSQEKLREFQFLNLKSIVEYAWTNIQGYRELWGKAGFTPEKLKSLEDIHLIPFVTKDMIRDNLDKFSNTSIKRLNYVTTGGSTGIPFGFYQESKNNFIEDAFIHDMWSKHVDNFSYSTKSTVLRGAKLKGIYEYGPANSLTLSSYDINLVNIQKYLKLIDYHKTPILQAYPSAIYLMAKIMKSENLQLKHKFLAIMLGSEPLYSFQRKLLNEIFNTKIVHWYGHAERVVLAGNCNADNRFHIYPQYGITEILNESNLPVQEGKTGEIIGTSFWNFATPLIRYRTRDFAELGASSCEKCGRNYQLLNKIEGRLQEFLVTKDKRLISMTAINMHDDIFDDLMQFRFYQDKMGEVTFNYVRKPNIDEVNEDKIYKGLKTKITNCNLHLKELNNIKLTKNGKLRFLDQQLNINNLI
jgi:phenylacetate-CoA ligase